MSDWTTAEAMVAEALRITHEDRNAANGEPEDNFAYIALMWTALLRARGVLATPDEITAADVARMMTAMKMARDAHSPHRDNRTDAVGYTICLERVEPTGLQK
jgi:hypothetical protein